MSALPVPVGAPPILFGERSTSAVLPWSWAAERLTDARNYWVAASRSDGRPICRPLWAVWHEDGLWFTTGSQMIRSLGARAPVSVNLEDGSEVLIFEGVAERITAPSDLERFVEAYNGKYEHTAVVAGDEIADASGPIGPAYRVTPHVVFGWQAEMRDPTRWTFPTKDAQHET